MIIAGEEIVKIVVPLKGISFATREFNTEEFNLYLYGASAMIHIVKTQKIYESIGGYTASEIGKNPCAYSALKLSATDFAHDGVLTEMKYITTRVDHFFTCLWFLKDHSIVIRNCYAFRNESLRVQEFNRWVTLADGTFGTIEISVEELLEAKEVQLKIQSILESRVPDDVDVLNSKAGFNSSGINEIYKDFDRVSRSLTFLNRARSEEHLPAKISFYIAVLECLFTNDKTEVVHKVTERATLVLGGNFEDKLINYKLIKNAYDIRSKYVHGGELKNDKKFITYEMFKASSVAIDDIVRRILKIVIFEKYDKFNSAESLEAWFKELLFKDK